MYCDPMEGDCKGVRTKDKKPQSKQFKRRFNVAIIWRCLECSLALDKSDYLKFIRFQELVKIPIVLIVSNQYVALQSLPSSVTYPEYSPFLGKIQSLPHCFVSSGLIISGTSMDCYGRSLVLELEDYGKHGGLLDSSEN